MADKAHKKVDKQITDLDKRLQQIYGRAEHELQAKYSDFMNRYQAKAQIWKEQLDAGEITKSEYASKIQGQIFQQKQWQSKVYEMSQTLLHTNQLATKLVNGQLADVFIGNANYSLYSMEHSAGVSFGFSMYDKTTVARLVKDEPSLLPVKKVDEAADLAWNQKKNSPHHQKTDGTDCSELRNHLAHLNYVLETPVLSSDSTTFPCISARTTMLVAWQFGFSHTI